MKMIFINILVEYCEIYKEKINPEKEVKIKHHYLFLKIKQKP